VDELPKHARALLDISRDADDPSALARARSDAAVRTALAQHGICDLPAPDASPRGLGTNAVTRAGLGLQVGIAAFAVMGAVIGAWLLWPAATEPGPKPSAERRAPATLQHQVPERRPETVDVEAAPQSVSANQHSVVEGRPTRPARATRHPQPVGDAALARELKILASVDDLIRSGEHAQALRVLDRTEPSSGPHILREERGALRVLARCGHDPNAQALRERERFLSSSPHSVLAARVRSACVGGERP